MKEDYTNNNNVYLMGTIDTDPVYTHTPFGEGYYESAIRIVRLSEHSDIVPLTISEKIMEGFPTEKGRMVGITGQFRSYNKMVDGRSKLMLTVFVKDMEEGYYSDKNPNQIELIGFICKEPIFRTTPFKREICDILLAVNRGFCKSDYIPCITWGRHARMASSLPVGTKVVISGRIQSREYRKTLPNGDIETRTAYEISVGRMELADGGVGDGDNYFYMD